MYLLFKFLDTKLSDCPEFKEQDNGSLELRELIFLFQSKKGLGPRWIEKGLPMAALNQFHLNILKWLSINLRERITNVGSEPSSFACLVFPCTVYQLRGFIPIIIQISATRNKSGHQDSNQRYFAFCYEIQWRLNAIDHPVFDIQVI